MSKKKCGRLGIPLVISAPSGAGKTTLIKRLRQEFELGFSISCTTRPPREGEVDGRDYYFLDQQEFLSRRDAGDFAEWAFVHGNYYGTPFGPLRERLSAGEDMIFDIDVQGAAQLSLSLPQARFVFIMPPSLTVLKERLTHRGTDNASTIELRITNAKTEIGGAHWFDAWIINDELEQAYAELKAFYMACTTTPALRPHLIREILGES